MNRRMMRRNIQDSVKIGPIDGGQDKSTRQPAYRVDGGRRIDGTSPIQAFLWNYGKGVCDVKGIHQEQQLKVQMPEVHTPGGLSYMSAEAPVMGVEQRRQAEQPRRQKQPIHVNGGEGSVIKAKPFKIDKKLVLAAWRRVKANGGAAGIDGQTIAQFEKRLRDNLYCLWNRMSSGTYFPDATRSVSVPKASVGKRVLEIPTVRDRIAQTVVKMLMEPELEKVFDDNSFGGRPKRSAHQAIASTRKRCWEFDWVVEFDIKAMFDCIDQDLLMKALRHHKQARWIHLYVDRWLKGQIVDEEGGTSLRNRGVPQGGPLSPLLANLFLHYAFDAWMRKQFHHLPFCRYIDDGLVHCRSFEEAQQVLCALGARMNGCGLQVHPTKTSIVYCKDSKRKGDHENIQFTFLGYNFRPRRSFGRGHIFLNFLPAISPNAEADIRGQIRRWKLRSQSHLSLREVALKVRSVIQGWINYYGVFYRSQLRRVAAYINSKLVKWAMRRYKHLRGRRAKAEMWMESIMKSRSRLFPHWWGLVSTRMAV